MRKMLTKAVLFMIVLMLVFGSNTISALALDPGDILWERNLEVTAENLTDIAYGNGVYVAVGRSDIIKTSSDGINWSVTSWGNYNGVQSVMWSGKEFLIAAGDGSIVKSTDGKTWSKITQIGSGFNISNKIIYNDKQYLIVGTNNVISPDCVIWKQIRIPFKLFDVLWDGAKYIGVGASGVILSSEDGITWTQCTSDTNKNIYSICKSANGYVAVGADGIMLTSLNGIQWNTKTVAQGRALNKVIWNGSRYIAVGKSGSIITSNDGTDWTDIFSGASNNLNAVAWDGKQFIAVGDEGIIITSEYGINWFDRNEQRVSRFNNVRSVNNVFYTAGSKGTLLCSKDGYSWSTLDTGIAEELYDIAYNNERYIAVGNGVMITSYDGKTWYVSRQRIYQTYTCIIWTGSMFVAAGNSNGSGCILTSVDGITWSEKRITENSGLCDLAFDGKQYVAVGYDGCIYSSLDSDNWTLRQSGTTESFFGICSNGNKFVAVGVRGAMTYSVDGISWTKINGTNNSLGAVIWDGKQFVAIGSVREVFVSNDGIVWKSHLVGDGKFYLGLAYNGTNYVICGYQGTLVTGRIKSSDVGISSSKYLIDNSLSTISDITFGTSIVDFKNNITAATGATLNVYDSTGTNEINFSTITNKMRLRISAEDGKTTKAYTLLVNKNTDTTIKSAIYKVDNKILTISDIPFGATVSKFKSGLILPEGATYKVLNSNGEVTDGRATTGLEVKVTAEDGATQATYKLTVNKNTEALIASSKYKVDNTKWNISNLPYGTLYANFIADLQISEGGSVKLYAEDNKTEVKEGTVKTNMVVIVTSEDAKTVNSYKVITNKNTDATVASKDYDIDNEKLTIVGMSYGQDVDQFIKNLVPAYGAKLKVFDGSNEVAAGNIKTGMKVTITAEDGTTQKTYEIATNKNTDSTLASANYKVDNFKLEISNIPYDTPISAFKRNIQPAYGASIKVLDGDIEITTGAIKAGMNIKVTAEDGITTKSYTIKVNPIKIIVNNKAVSPSNDPMIEENIVLVPAESIMKSMGVKYTWNSKAKVITLAYRNKKIELKIDSKTALVNGKKFSIKVPARSNKVSYVPLEFVCKEFGFKYSFDGKTKTVTIKK